MVTCPTREMRIMNKKGNNLLSSDTFITVYYVICVYKGLPSQADCLTSMSMISPQRSPMLPHLRLSCTDLLFPSPLLLKLMTWLLISPVWGPSMLSNGIIQAPFTPIFNYI